MLSRRNDTNWSWVDEMRVGEMRVDEIRVGEMRVDEIRVGEMRVDEMKVGEMRRPPFLNEDQTEVSKVIHL